MRLHARTHVRWHGQTVAARVEGAAGQGSHSAARMILRKSRPRCPYDHGPRGGQPAGHMRDSGRVFMVKPGVAAVGYRRPGPKGDLITARQHEDLTLHHADGEAKWLERTLDEYRGAAVVEIIRPVRMLLGSARRRG